MEGRVIRAHHLPESTQTKAAAVEAKARALADQQDPVRADLNRGAFNPFPRSGLRAPLRNALDEGLDISLKPSNAGDMASMTSLT
ncbi:hypothetical protein MY11210_009565 [Beauveria gryllotalpidicola]